jgi:hypothetical protein
MFRVITNLSGLPTASAEADFVKMLPSAGLSQEAKAEGNYTYRLLAGVLFN